MSERAYGQVQGLGERLAYWANQFSRDKSYPWVGSGVIDDLKIAAKQMGVDFDKLYPLNVGGPPKPPTPPPPPPPKPPAPPPPVFDL